MLPHELTVPVQVVFASPTADGVVLDCTVAASVVVPGGVRIPHGAPFSLVIDDRRGAGREVDPLLAMLRRWCAQDVVVDAVTCDENRRVVLRHEAEELVLEVI